MDTKRVRMLVGISGDDFGWHPGQIVDMTADEAAKWADGERAVYARPGEVELSADLDTLKAALDQLQAELATVTAERDQLQAELAAMTAERDTLHADVAAAAAVDDDPVDQVAQDQADEPNPPTPGPADAPTQDPADEPTAKAPTGRPRRSGTGR